MAMAQRLRHAPVTVGIASVTAVLSFLSMSSPRASELFAIVPGLVLTGPSMIPNLVTASMVETTFWKLCLVLLVILACGPIGERAQGSLRFSMFMGITCVAGTLVAALLEVIGYISTRDADLLFRPVHGTAGLCTALALAAHQAAPDLVLLALPSALPSGALRARRMPIACTLCFSVLALLGYGLDGLMLVGCFFIGWLYLRYFQPANASTNPQQAPGSPVAPATASPSASGDCRDHMTFVALFPQPLRGLISPVASLCGAMTRPCLPRELGQGNTFPDAPPAQSVPAYAAMQPQASGSEEAPVLGADDGLGAGGALDPVAERRRAKARKALDTRLAELERRRLQRGPRVSQARLLAEKPGAATPAATPAEIAEPTAAVAEPAGADV